MEFAEFIRSSFLQVAPYTSVTNAKHGENLEEINQFCYQNCHSTSTVLSLLFAKGSFFKPGYASMNRVEDISNLEIMNMTNKVIVIKFEFDENSWLWGHTVCIIARNNHFYWCESFQTKKYLTISLLHKHELMIKLCNMKYDYPQRTNTIFGVNKLNDGQTVHNIISKYYINYKYSKTDQKMIDYCKKNSLHEHVKTKFGL